MSSFLHALDSATDLAADLALVVAGLALLLLCALLALFVGWLFFVA